MKPFITAACAAVAIVALALVLQPRAASAQGCSAQAFNGEFEQLTSRYPMQSHWGSRATFQYSYFLGTRGIELLNRYSGCMSAADFNANRQALEGMRDQGLRGCQQLSTNADSCTPTYPG